MRVFRPPLTRTAGGGFGRFAVTDRREEGMDSTAGSGHRPTGAVGAPIYSWENQAV